MKFKASLTAAINAADLVILDGYEAGFSFRESHDAAQLIERSDEEIVGYTDQEIEIDDGQAFFDDINGKEHEIIFTVSRRLQPRDIK